MNTGKRVLLVEDDPLVAESLRRALCRTCEVGIALTYFDARKLIAEGGWAAFLIDVNLPDGSGVDLLESIRDEHPNEPIMLMTGGELTRVSRVAVVYSAMLVAKPLPTEWLQTFRGWIHGVPSAPPSSPPSFDSRAGVQARASLLGARLSALGLTDRESAVFGALATGAKAEVVAERMGIAVSTVRAHCYRVYRRLGATSLKEVLAKANGWHEAALLHGGEGVEWGEGALT